jgi:hypothetical protein
MLKRIDIELSDDNVIVIKEFNIMLGINNW